MQQAPSKEWVQGAAEGPRLRQARATWQLPGGGDIGVSHLVGVGEWRKASQTERTIMSRS